MSDGRIKTPAGVPAYSRKFMCLDCGGYNDAPNGNCASPLHKPRSYISGVKPPVD